MDLKALVHMEVQKGERVYRLIMDNGAPYGEAIDVAFELLQKLIDIAKTAADAAKNAPVVDTTAQ